MRTARSWGCPDELRTELTVVDLARFLDDLASGRPAPSAGAAAAVTVAVSASLTAMVARSSSRVGDGAEVAARADDLRTQALAGIDEDARRYRQVLASEPTREDDPERFTEAMRGANVVPAEVASLADEVSRAATRLVFEGSPRLRGDAITAVVLASSAAAAVTTLIEINTTYGQLEDDELEVARSLQAACRQRVVDVGGYA